MYMKVAMTRKQVCKIKNAKMLVQQTLVVNCIEFHKLNFRADMENYIFQSDNDSNF